jgi:MFS family permease
MNRKAPGLHPENSMFAVFRNRAFGYLWTAQAISSMGSALTSLGAAILVYRVTESALSVGLMLIATAGPTILVGLFAGVFVDRYDRKRIMLAADVARGLLIGLVPLLLTFHIAWLYVIVILVSAITQFFDSAFASVLPEVTPDKDLSAANGLLAIASVGSTTVGFAAAGMIASGLNIEWVFYADAITFLVSAACVLRAHIPKLPALESSSLRAIGRNLVAGLRVVRTTPSLRSLFLIVIPIFLIFGLQNSLFLPFMSRALNGSEFHFGLQQAAEAIGIALGSLVMIRVADRLHEGQWLAISYLLMAGASIWYSFSNTITLAVLLVGLSGLVNAPSFIGRQLVIQRSTPREMRGRVNSAFFVVRDFMSVLGMAAAGLADVFDVRRMFLFSSYALLAAGAGVLVMPGLSQPLANWKRLWNLLRGVEAAPRLGAGRSATTAEANRFIASRPELTGMSAQEQERFRAQVLVAEAPPGRTIVYRGEFSDAAFFILSGSVGVGRLKPEEYEILGYLKPGELFGEIAAMTGEQRTATVITEEPSEFLVIPSKVLRELAQRHAELGKALFITIAAHLSRTEMPVGPSLDQESLRELRTDEKV